MSWVYRRDASWHATIGYAAAWHTPHPLDPARAACSRLIALDENTISDHRDIPADLLCRRRGCVVHRDMTA